MHVHGVTYEAMLENPRNEYKLYTLTDGRIVPVLRYVPLDEKGDVIGNPGKGFFKPVEYEVTLGEEAQLEIIGPLEINEPHIMFKRFVTKAMMVKILLNLQSTASVVVGTVL